MILETERLILREMKPSDFSALCRVLQDEEVMVAYEHAFSDDEVQDWLLNQLNWYEKYGFGLWAVVLKSSGEIIGQCGLTMQDNGKEQVLEIGYLFEKAVWHQGYAIEAAAFCKKYAFEVLKAEVVYSIIRDTNLASQKVAKRNGMTQTGRVIKHYYNKVMPHVVFSLKRTNKN